MVKSTSYLIDEQSDLLDNVTSTSTKRKRVHTILTEQLAALDSERNSQSVSRNFKQSLDTTHVPNRPQTSLAFKQLENLTKNTRKSELDSNLLNKTKESRIIGNVQPKSKEPTKVVKKVPPKDSKKVKLSDKNFIDLLTGENNTIQSDSNPALKMREQLCQSHVMKSLGGYKFLENNKFDNFVVSILPKIENSKVVSKY